MNPKKDKAKILLVGTSYMAEEYLKVLKSIRVDVQVIGRNDEKAKILAQKYGYEGLGGGEETLSRLDPKKYGQAIVASSVESLKNVTITLMNIGFNKILIEKPGAMNLQELNELKSKIGKDTDLKIAYNRKFYNSVIMLKKHIEDDGGPVGCLFDFTEREKDIMNCPKDAQVITRWGFANSTHIIGTSFHLVGKPEELYTLRAGSWPQHPTGNVFVGHGKTNKCLFSYFATWCGGGRFNIEVSTIKGRYRLCPIEELFFCEKNQFKWERIEHPDRDDIEFKPGLLKEVKAFLKGGPNKHLLMTIDEQIEDCKIVNKIFGYD